MTIAHRKPLNHCPSTAFVLPKIFFGGKLTQHGDRWRNLGTRGAGLPTRPPSKARLSHLVHKRGASGPIGSKTGPPLRVGSSSVQAQSGDALAGAVAKNFMRNPNLRLNSRGNHVHRSEATECEIPAQAVPGQQAVQGNEFALANGTSFATVYSAPRNPHHSNLIKPLNQSDPLSPPPLHRRPPRHPQPLIETRLRPLTVRPPSCPELRRIAGGRHREDPPFHLMPENTERSPRVKLRRHNQNPITRLTRQTLRNIVRFIARRKPFDRTNRDRRRLRQALNILLRQLDLRKLVDPRLGRDIEQHPRSISPAQKLHRRRRAPIRLACQNDDHVRRRRLIHHQQLARAESERHYRDGKHPGCKFPRA